MYSFNKLHIKISGFIYSCLEKSNLKKTNLNTTKLSSLNMVNQPFLKTSPKHQAIPKTPNQDPPPKHLAIPKTLNRVFSR
mmetsp:Transcript_15739/g.23139  ORF Transcript_15739/g.23139 Transcript_15739/m.23139 type:complete len:80 (-) Transcript_15739:490-729(-)